MDNNKKALLEKLTNLLSSLEKTKNPTCTFYKKVIAEIAGAKTNQELIELIKEHIIGSGTITDYGGFNREQYNLFGEMYGFSSQIYNDLLKQ